MKTKPIKSVTKVKTKPEKKKGRPTVYHTRMNRIAMNFCLLGATNEKLATVFDVDPATISAWVAKYPAFRKAIADGRENADAEVAQALYHRAKGYKHKATKLQLHRDGSWKEKEYTEVYPPDTNAARLWLMNRHPDKWKEKLDVAQTITVKVPGEENPTE